MFPPRTNIPEAYVNGSSEEHVFLHLQVMICSFLEFFLLFHNKTHDYVL